MLQRFGTTRRSELCKLIDRLRQAGLEEYLKEAAGVDHLEVCGHLVSVAAPHDGAAQMPLDLLAAVRRLARLL